MRKAFAAFAALTLAATTAIAQDAIPRGNPSVLVGGKKVSVDYGRPSLKGRTLDQLLSQLAADRVWRAGANQVTTLTAEADVLVGGRLLKAGKYSLYVHAPATGDWSLLFNHDHGVPLGQTWDKAPEALKNAPWPVMQDYDKTIGAKEAARVPLKLLAAPAAPVEQFTIELVAEPQGGRLQMSWGDRAWAIDLKPTK